MLKLIEETITKEQIYKGRVFVVEKHQILSPDGQHSTREIVVHNGGAAILALDQNNFVPMVRQFRLAAGKCILEVPAGKLESGETALNCARRELAEETGCKAHKWISLGGAYPTPGYSSEQIHLFLARDLEKGKLDLDDGEFLEVEWYPIDVLYKMVLAGEIIDGKSIQAILLSKELLDAEAENNCERAE